MGLWDPPHSNSRDLASLAQGQATEYSDRPEDETGCGFTHATVSGIEMAVPIGLGSQPTQGRPIRRPILPNGRLRTPGCSHGVEFDRFGSVCTIRFTGPPMTVLLGSICLAFHLAQRPSFSCRDKCTTKRSNLHRLNDWRDRIPRTADFVRRGGRHILGLAPSALLSKFFTIPPWPFSPVLSCPRGPLPSSKTEIGPETRCPRIQATFL